MELNEVIPSRYRDRNTIRNLSKARRKVFIHDNFTEVIFVNGNGQVASGVAKRNPHDDEPNPEVGERIATIRAYRNYKENGWR